MPGLQSYWVLKIVGRFGENGGISKGEVFSLLRKKYKIRSEKAQVLLRRLRKKKFLHQKAVSGERFYMLSLTGKSWLRRRASVMLIGNLALAAGIVAAITGLLAACLSLL